VTRLSRTFVDYLRPRCQWGPLDARCESAASHIARWRIVYGNGHFNSGIVLACRTHGRIVERLR